MENKKKKKIIRFKKDGDFKDLFELMYMNKEATSHQKKKDYYKRKNKNNGNDNDSL
jgi:hypothetical protein